MQPALGKSARSIAESLKEDNQSQVEQMFHLDHH